MKTLFGDSFLLYLYLCHLHGDMVQCRAGPGNMACFIYR
jgi:hypothetical protein